MVLVRALEHAGSRMGDIINARARQAVFGQHVDGFVQIAPPVFEGGSGAAQLGDEPLEHLGNRVAGPGIGHGDGDAVDVGERRGTVHEMMVMGTQS